MSADPEQFVHNLFRSSVLKQAKYTQIIALLEDTQQKSCLDIGGDNGIISYLLRQRGGVWSSADLDPRTVESIRSLVGGDVRQIDGLATPFGDDQFDCVVIIDFLEHVHTDREFVDELRRIMRPGGQLIVNVPHIKPYSLLNRFRHLIGLTDEKHGHVRPGYSIEGLTRTLSPHFQVTRLRTYSRAFSEIVDTVLSFGYLVLKSGKGKAGGQSQKGTVVNQDDMAQHGGGFRLLALAYPFLWLFSQLDRLLFLQQGYKLIVTANLRPHPGNGDGP